MSSSIFARLMIIASTIFVLVNTYARESVAAYSLTPRQLVSLARQGRFKAQGIPSHDNFRNAVRTGKITATELIDRAIATQSLPESARGDREYLAVLTSHLKSGGCGS